MKNWTTAARTILSVLAMLGLTGLTPSLFGQTVSIPDPGLDAAVREALQKPTGPLTEQDLLLLTVLNASGRSITNAQGLQAARNLTDLDLDSNSLASFTVPGTWTNLVTLDLFNNHLTNFSLPGAFPKLFALDLGFNTLSQCSLPNGLTNLNTLFLEGNRLTNFTVPFGLTALTKLDLAGNALNNFTLPPDATNLVNLLLFANQLTNVTLPPNLNRLSGLLLDFNNLRSLTLPAGLTNLNRLTFNANQLTNLALPEDMTSLTFLDVRGNQLTNLTLTPGQMNLTSLFVDGNPLITLVLPEPLAATSLAATVTALQNQGVQVFTYPLSVQLTFPRQQPIGAFRFGITGPPGTYTVLSSTNLSTWNALGIAPNPLGSVFFIDTTANLSPRKFYRTLSHSPPPNMVFIAPNTFTLGSPTNEVGHRTDESPQTTVTLTRGFWISKFLVTQQDFLAVTGSNPSQFPGDLNRPVESVSWFAASNYCVQLTQQDLAAGRIPPGTHYRLPTEAEWECAARAGTSTRFYYGDDPNVTNLTNHAWYGANSGFTARPVGQKLPNAWGLFDMEGNVWEWCQDWYGPYAGGTVTDPQGPPSNQIGFKVIRGGAWEAFELDCRSARRSIEGASPFISDFIIGFRVVLVSD